jgi:alpha,alpha-trehalase
VTTHPIDSHALLSDTHTTALVAPDGGVDWFCAPAADGESVFARILDTERGGSWSLTVDGAEVVERGYLPYTFVLRTLWSGDRGDAEVLEALAVAAPGAGEDQDELAARHVLVRLVRCTRGTARVRTVVDARPDHARAQPDWERDGQAWAERVSGLRLYGDVALDVQDGLLTGAVELADGQAAGMHLSYHDDGQDDGQDDGGTPAWSSAQDAQRALEDTTAAWRAWDAPCDYAGPAHELVHRSALVLRALAFDETGALLAAPTTSLPELIGGGRNWDYRFTWHRDAGLHVLAMFRLGHAELGRRYLRFLLDRCVQGVDRLRPMAGLRGEQTGEEIELEHLTGYAQSPPVRVGNEAFEQLQVDTYGHVLESVHTYWLLTGELDPDDWPTVRGVVDACSELWSEPDAGIWETRGGAQHHVNSKVYAWVCLDRGIRLAEALGAEADLEGWRRARDAVHAEVLERGYDQELGAFVVSYELRELDASLLRIPIVGFLPADDPRVVSTVERICEGLADGPALVHRYDTDRVDDGIDGGEGAFLLSSFEVVVALVLAGRVEEARRRFDWLVERVGPLDLYSEQMESDGTALGNYPQAFTHLGLIEAALTLQDAQDGDALTAWTRRDRVPGFSPPAPG